MIADFLIYLRRDKGLSVPAVKGYRAALNTVFSLRDKDLASSREISMLIRSFSKDVRPPEVRPPAWDVTLVLESLKKAPYEPLRSVEERFLTQKTLFLLALASSKRIGELQGLSFRVSHTRGWKQMTCSFLPEFVAKTQDPSVPDPKYESFSVPALGETVREGRLLCPVRAMRIYLERTALHRPALRRLFLSTSSRKKEVSKNTISLWLRKVIVRAYELAGRVPPERPRARETRALAPRFSLPVTSPSSR